MHLDAYLFEPVTRGVGVACLEFRPSVIRIRINTQLEEDTLPVPKNWIILFFASLSEKTDRVFCARTRLANTVTPCCVIDGDEPTASSAPMNVVRAKSIQPGRVGKLALVTKDAGVLKHTFPCASDTWYRSSICIVNMQASTPPLALVGMSSISIRPSVLDGIITGKRLDLRMTSKRPFNLHVLGTYVPLKSPRFCMNSSTLMGAHTSTRCVWVIGMASTLPSESMSSATT